MIEAVNKRIAEKEWKGAEGKVIDAQDTKLSPGFTHHHQLWDKIHATAAGRAERMSPGYFCLVVLSLSPAGNIMADMTG
ncbi:hypothetical protein FRB94_004358 [Tulasnella sp. JGI-2019a]|nr:hypothetical protein FRB93_000359 [Tulasnella sp. JGI-2019a]KAG9015239.1 hypothetical protein FRB94_004358 [Tulasnella sp. JGI-2019a]